MTGILSLLQSAWSDILIPFVTMLWDLAWSDPMHFVAVLVIIYVIIWAARDSARLGR